ncbi:MAG: hypothetical protein HY779_00975 [Rubrobacteridae bacterium]|nr:hypothetical protein [Rubrobacteridae bacterium]
MAMEEKKGRIPEFKNKEEEHEFYATHSGVDYINEVKEITESVAIAPPKRKTTVRLDDTATKRIKAIAEQKGMPWQTSMRS